jgi:hypothetical protein
MPLVKSRYPGLSVVLFKNIGRSTLSGASATPTPVSQRYAGQSSVLDVTKYIGERGVVNVQKSVRDPAGSFSIDFMDQLVQKGAADSLYGLFEPMDVVEIRMSANGGTGATNLPIMMRGFISRVSRSQSMGGDGRPSRKVTIAGQDYGKIWQIDNIYYNPWVPDEQNYITQFKFFTRFGDQFDTTSAGQLVTNVITTVINKFFLAPMQATTTNSGVGSSPVVQLGLDVQTQGGSVAPYGVNDWQGGSVYALLTQFCDVGPWNELFIEDRDAGTGGTAGPYVVYRPNPYIAVGGDVTNAASYIQAAAKLADYTAVSSSDIIGMEVSRSDANVANYFWVEAPTYDMNFAMLGKAMAGQGTKSTFIIKGYGNVDSTLYGFKRMAEQSNQGSPLVHNAGNGTPAPQQRKDAANTLDWINQRRADLVSQNHDNVVFESGSIRLAGNEGVKAGTYLLVKHGNMTSTYYVPSVAHSFTPFGTYVTTATVERGTGFIDRAGKGGGQDSPYLAELADAQA